MKNPLVSILLPCYNHEKYINSCIESVLAQTYKNIEIIICDDNSNDNSFEIIKSYKESLLSRFVNVIISKNKENLGICKNLNRMLENANGDYIKILATDDMLEKDGIKNLINFIVKNNCDILFSNGYIVDENTTYNDCFGNDRIYKNKPVLDCNLTNALLKNCFISAPTVLIPKHTFNKYGYFNEKLLTEDWEYWLRISKSGKIRYLDEPTVFYRKSKGSLSRFGYSKSENERFNKFLKNELIIFNMYSEYADGVSKNIFYNRIFKGFIATNDKSQINTIYLLSKNKEFDMFIDNKIRKILFDINIYNKLRFIKRLLFK